MQVAKSKLTPIWEAEIKEALAGKFTENETHIFFSIQDAAEAKTNYNNRFYFFSWVFEAPEILPSLTIKGREVPPEFLWLPTYQTGAIIFDYQINGERFNVEIEVPYEEFVEVCDWAHLLEPSDNLDDILDAGLYPSAAKHCIVIYALKYGVHEQIEQAYAEHMADKEAKTFKPALEAMLSETAKAA